MSWQALALGSSGLSAGGSIGGGFQRASADRYNAAVAGMEATQVQREAAAEATQTAQQTKRILGATLANAGASGVDPNQGSPVNVMSDIAQQGELSRQLVLYRGALRATGYRSQASLDRYYAGQDIGAGIMTGGSTFLTGYARYRQSQIDQSGTGGPQ